MVGSTGLETDITCEFESRLENRSRGYYRPSIRSSPIPEGLSFAIHRQHTVTHVALTAAFCLESMCERSLALSGTSSADSV